ncbi:MAG: Eco57I restriction-modification methylase domain-containing protein [Phycisphaerae bacterium]|nr:Eco57I restriction-modification methylase domain-containing protein [Phycisphaerae bacterium]
MAQRQLTLPLGPIRNSNLFSNHWLEHRLPLEPEWEELRDEAVRLLDRLGQLWIQQRRRVERYSEPGLEQAFIQPVLAELGWKLNYQTFLRGRKPDYALFLDDESFDAALETGRKSPNFWNYPTLVADAKAWHINLDRPTIINNQREYPPEQIEWYVNHSGLDYGLLTNGRLWRLIPSRLSGHQPRFETYLEFDLAVLLDLWTGKGKRKRQRTFDEQQRIIEDFLRFFLFFSPHGYRAIDDRKPLIERAVQGSSEYRLGVSEGLKKRVFEALQICIEGFLTYGPNGLNPDTDLPKCREQSFVFLYRLLFIMYAEDRGLLPYRTHRLYAENRSLGRLRDEIAGRIDNIEEGRAEDFAEDSQDLWDDLTSLFDLIDSGGKRYGVPAYNGGLFDPEDSAFLSKNTLPDSYLARLIDRLGRALDKDHPDAGLFRVDYRDLSIQHIGHIYEGLLELQPHFATEPMIVIRGARRQKIREDVVPEYETIPDGFEDTGTRYETGQVYLLTDKGERRTTGSYYTPTHIVDYIIGQTLGPLCQEINQELSGEIEETGKKYSRSRGRNRELLKQNLERLQTDFDDRILQLRVLDPAMGSGHFLLRACQYLAEEIATNPNTGDPHADQVCGDESVLTFWKRRIVEHCLHGVDMNPLAVELAKVALWLETASKDQPLTFLDHHLRHGNSLVGGSVSLLGTLPGADPMPLFEQQVSARLPRLLGSLKQIGDMPSETRDQVKEKSRIYRQAFDKIRKPFVAVADLWCATFFLDDKHQLKPEQYSDALQTLGTPVKHRRLAKKGWFQEAIGTAHRPDVACFHWELEFPEAFFDLSGRREEGGFDAIIGNPPYDVLSDKETGCDLSALRRFLRAQPIYEASFRGKNNLYKLFVCRVLALLAQGGRMGVITPMAVLGDDQAANIRKQILGTGAFTSIDAFPQKDDAAWRVFPEAKLSTAVFSLIKIEDEQLRAQPFVSRVHPAQFIEEDSPSLQLTTTDIPLYDPSNLTIVSCSQEDWDLAARITGSGRMARMGDYSESFQGEVNETNDRNAGRISYDSSDGPEAMRGAHLCLYTLREASQGTPVFVKVNDFLNRSSRDSKAFHHQYPRIGFQRKSPQNNFRRLIAAPIAKGTFLVESISYVPEHLCSIPLEVVLGVLNSKLADWYFRLGSTNAMVGEYQFKNLPCPAFSDRLAKADKEIMADSLAALKTGNLDQAFDLLISGMADPPFSPVVRDVIIALVRRIIMAEQARGEIARTERSALCPQAQPYQDLIDRLLYAMAGLTGDESHGLEERLSNML